MNKDIENILKQVDITHKIGMLTLGGSIAYGTNLPSKGDIDIRGFAFEPKDQLIGNITNFETISHTETDTVIYSFNKFIRLLMDNNPNILEALGCREEDYIYKSEVATELIKNLDKFIYKRVFHTFGGYARMQLDRMENAMGEVGADKKLKQIERSIERALYSFEERYSKYSEGSIIVNNEEGEVVLDIDIKRVPLKQMVSMLSEFTNIQKSYSKLNHRNKKKDTEALDKHAMHIIRLLLTGIELVTTGKMKTYRGDDRELLLDIRRGKFRNPDGTYNSSYYDLKKDLDKKFEYAEKNSVLPQKPDYDWINDFIYRVNYNNITDSIEGKSIEEIIKLGIR